jgi:hypothetical protein
MVFHIRPISISHVSFYVYPFFAFILIENIIVPSNQGKPDFLITIVTMYSATLGAALATLASLSIAAAHGTVSGIVADGVL